MRSSQVYPQEEEQLELFEKQKRLKPQGKAKQQQEATFEKLAYETIQYLQHEWTNHKTAKQWESILKAYAFPIIKHEPQTY